MSIVFRIHEISHEIDVLTSLVQVLVAQIEAVTEHMTMTEPLRWRPTSPELPLTPLSQSSLTWRRSRRSLSLVSPNGGRRRP
jgi:hypothetical protein